MIGLLYVCLALAWCLYLLTIQLEGCVHIDMCVCSSGSYLKAPSHISLAVLTAVGILIFFSFFAEHCFVSAFWQL